MKVLAVGEVMMRLTPPSYKLIEQTDNLDLSFSGTGLNILSGLARNGISTSILTNVPNNSVGDAAKAYTRRLGVSDTFVNQVGNHIGIYFLEVGYGNRPSQVTYLNRDESAFCVEDTSTKLIDEAIISHDIVHVCGIALSTSEKSRKLILDVVKRAVKNNKIIIFDFNFRPSLNQGIEMQRLLEDYQFILKSSTIVFGNKLDLSKLYASPKLDENELLKQFFIDYPNIKLFCGTSKSKDNKIYATIHTKERSIKSSEKELTIFDRIGTGDSYAFGIIYGFIKNWNLEKSIEFAVTASELAHTTFGDSSVLSEGFITKYMENPNQGIFR